MLPRTIRFIPPAMALAALAVVPFLAAQPSRPQPPKSVRLYVLDCGKITGVGEDRFGFKQGQLATTEMITPCFLIVHPRGTLMWDVGEIPDSEFPADGSPAKQSRVGPPLSRGLLLSHVDAEAHAPAVVHRQERGARVPAVIKAKAHPETLFRDHIVHKLNREEMTGTQDGLLILVQTPALGEFHTGLVQPFAL